MAAGLTEGATALFCGPCRTGAFHFDLARVYGIYRGVLRRVILQLKFRRRERLARKLGALLAEVWQKHQAIHPAENLLLVPVPLHSSRERERGFNQSWLLAQALLRSLPAVAPAKRPRLERRVLLRTRATTAQTGLSLSARRENVRGGFQVRRPDRVRGRNIVLVDDVMTTGATLSACAAALKAAGAAHVSALAVARATPQFPDFALSAGGSEVDARPGERT
jgi:ComF family protein